MLDIFEDSCDDLEIDRVKDKIRAIWSKIVVAEYNNEFGNMNDDDENYKTLEQYLAENELHFPGDPEPENEMLDIVKMLEEMFDPKEELDSVEKDGKAPTYNGEQLKSHNEKGKIEATVYEVKHSSTKTPKDSKSAVKSGTYKAPTSGRIAKRTDSKVKTSYRPMIEKIVEELLSLDDRRRAGYKERKQRL